MCACVTYWLLSPHKPDVEEWSGVFSPPHTCPAVHSPFPELLGLLPRQCCMFFHSYTCKIFIQHISTHLPFLPKMYSRSAFCLVSVGDTEVYSRGVDGCAIHQRGVVVVFDEVAFLGLLFTFFWLVSDGDLGAVWRVMEVDDVNVKHQHSWTGDFRAWEGNSEKKKRKTISNSSPPNLWILYKSARACVL